MTRATWPLAACAIALAFVFNHWIISDSADFLSGALIGILLLATVIIGWLLARGLYSIPQRANVVVASGVLWLCYFGAVFDPIQHLVENSPVAAIVRFRYAMPLATLCLLAIASYSKPAKPAWEKCQRGLNLMSVFLVMFSLFSFGQRNLAAQQLVQRPPLNRTTPVANPPDVYWIVLDSYTGSESLQRYWNYDNSAFLQQLRRRGFHVLPNATSDYRATQQSIASTLMMEYLTGSISPDSGMSHLLLPAEIRRSVVPETFRHWGYQLINLSLFDWAGTPRRYSVLDYSGRPGDVMWNRTVLGMIQMRGRDQASLNLELFRALETLPARGPAEPPRFVYAHLMIPHFPYFFDHSGRRQTDPTPTDPTKKKHAYLEQLRYVNQRIDACITSLLKASPTPPMIILQGDHGFRFLGGESGEKEGNSILHAQLWPDGRAHELPLNHSPVNTFRHIFNRFYGQKLPLQP